MERGLNESSSGGIRILHLDDDERFVDLTKEFLDQVADDFTVISETDPGTALDLVQSEDVDGIVSDYDMPAMDGLDFLEAVRENYPDLPFILFTGKGSEEIASEAISRGVTDYLQKGYGRDQYTVLANRMRNAVSQYRAVEEVERRSKWYQRILQHSSDYVMISDDMGDVSYVSPAIERVLGYTPDAVIGTNSFENIHPDDLEDAAAALAKTIEDPSAEVTAEFRAEAADGSYRWLEVRGRNFLDDPLINGVLVNVRGITERKIRDEALQRQEAFLEQSTDIIAILEPDGTFDYVSPSVSRVLGYTAEELTGETAFPFIHRDSRDDVLAVFEGLIAKPREHARTEFRFRNANDEWRWLEVRGSNHLDDPLIDGVMVNARDITERKEREQEIERQNERLDEFASVVSHDLRNPLTVATGHLDMASDECDSEHLAVVAKAHDRMNKLIDTLLTLAKSGEHVEELRPIDLARMAEQCWIGVETGTDSLVIEADGKIYADPTRLRQLVENLFRNALEHGGDDVTVTLGTLSEERGFYVEDDGIGIAESDLERVFDSGYSTSNDGTGFGLNIVAQVARAHGWDVSVTEGTNGGARFEVTGVTFVNASDRTER